MVGYATGACTMKLSSRPFRDGQDYAAMRTLAVDIYALAGPPVYATVGDLDWWRSTEDEMLAWAEQRRGGARPRAAGDVEGVGLRPRRGTQRPVGAAWVSAGG